MLITASYNRLIRESVPWSPEHMGGQFQRQFLGSVHRTPENPDALEDDNIQEYIRGLKIFSQSWLEKEGWMRCSGYDVQIKPCSHLGVAGVHVEMYVRITSQN